MRFYLFCLMYGAQSFKHDTQSAWLLLLFASLVGTGDTKLMHYGIR